MHIWYSVSATLELNTVSGQVISTVDYCKVMIPKFDQELEQYCMRYLYNDNSVFSTISSVPFVPRIIEICPRMLTQWVKEKCGRVF